MFKKLLGIQEESPKPKEERPKYTKTPYTFFGLDGEYVTIPKAIEGIVFILKNIIETEMYGSFSHLGISMRVIDELLLRGWLPPNLTDEDKKELLKIIIDKTSTKNV